LTSQNSKNKTGSSQTKRKLLRSSSKDRFEEDIAERSLAMATQKKNRKLREIQMKKYRSDPNYGTSMSYKLKNIKKRVMQPTNSPSGEFNPSYNSASHGLETSFKELSSFEHNNCTQ
jgi:hypothetical protein